MSNIEIPIRKIPINSFLKKVYKSNDLILLEKASLYVKNKAEYSILDLISNSLNKEYATKTLNKIKLLNDKESNKSANERNDDFLKSILTLKELDKIGLKVCNIEELEDLIIEVILNSGFTQKVYHGVKYEEYIAVEGKENITKEKIECVEILLDIYHRNIGSTNNNKDSNNKVLKLTSSQWSKKHSKNRERDGSNLYEKITKLILLNRNYWVLPIITNCFNKYLEDKLKKDILWAIDRLVAERCAVYILEHTFYNGLGKLNTIEKDTIKNLFNDDMCFYISNSFLKGLNAEHIKTLITHKQHRHNDNGQTTLEIWDLQDMEIERQKKDFIFNQLDNMKNAIKLKEDIESSISSNNVKRNVNKL